MTEIRPCMLRIVRGRQYADRLRSYKIYVNGTQVCTIGANAQQEVEVRSGPLSIEARIDWTRSRPLTIEARPGTTIEVEVSNEWSPLLALFAITIGAGNYLTLKQRLPASAA